MKNNRELSCCPHSCHYIDILVQLYFMQIYHNSKTNSCVTLSPEHKLYKVCIGVDVIAMYTVSRSSAGVCMIINSKCCSPQIKASGFGTKHLALISPKQVSVRYSLSFTLLSSSPPLSSVPPTLPTSSADIGSSSANPLVTEKRKG